MSSATPSICRADLSAIADLAITTVLVIETRIRADLALRRALLIPFFSDERSATLPDYSCVSRRAEVELMSVSKRPQRASRILVIDSTGLKGLRWKQEWKVKTHGRDAVRDMVKAASRR